MSELFNCSEWAQRELLDSPVEGKAVDLGLVLVDEVEPVLSGEQVPDPVVPVAEVDAQEAVDGEAQVHHLHEVDGLLAAHDEAVRCLDSRDRVEGGVLPGEVRQGGQAAVQLEGHQQRGLIRGAHGHDEVFVA